MSKPLLVENTSQYHALEINEENHMALRGWFDAGQPEWRSKGIEQVPDLQGFYVIRDQQGTLAIVDAGKFASEWEQVDGDEQSALFGEITNGEFQQALGDMVTTEEYQVTAVPDEDGPVWLDQPDGLTAKQWAKTATENGLEGRIRVRTVITVARAWKEIPA